MKQWKNLAEKDYLADIKPTSKMAKGMAVEKITLYTDQNIGGFKAKIVEELPEVGEDGILYLILKEESEEGDTYDEYIWVEKEEGEWGFEHIGATDKVEITLYDSTGQNTDGAMTQKAVTDALDGKADSSDVPDVVQTTGTSTTKVMSQNAVTNMVFADPANRNKITVGKNITTSATASNTEIAIGDDAISRGDRNIAIGKGAKADSGSSNIALGNASAYGSSSIAMGASAVTQRGASNSLAILWEAVAQAEGALAIGAQSKADYKYSVALGHGARTTAQGEMNIGGIGSRGYNNSEYRLLTGLYDPQNAHDAANKEYVDTQIGAIDTALQTLLNGGES